MLSSLVELDVHANRITGRIPAEYGMEGHWPLLSRLDLSRNSIAGKHHANPAMCALPA